MRKQLGIVTSLLFLGVSTLLWTGCRQNRCCNSCEPVCAPCKPSCPPKSCKPVCPPKPCRPVCPEPCKPTVCPEPCQPVCPEPCQPIRSCCPQPERPMIRPQGNQEFFQMERSSCSDRSNDSDEFQGMPSMPYESGQMRSIPSRQFEQSYQNSQYQMNAPQEFNSPTQFNGRPQFDRPQFDRSTNFPNRSAAESDIEMQ